MTYYFIHNINNSTELAGGEEIEKIERKKKYTKEQAANSFQLDQSCTFKEKVWYFVVNFALKFKCRNRCNISKTTTYS